MALIYESLNQYENSDSLFNLILGSDLHNAMDMNDYAYIISERESSTSEDLQYALSLAKKAIDLDPNNSMITHGANALKLEDEVKTENLEVPHTNEQEMSNFSSNSVEQTEHQNENVDSEIDSIEEKIETESSNSTSNGLENFQIHEEDTPNLFNSDESENNENTLSSPEVIEDKEEDDLEIPAFLRRQKN